jgi:outer membrane protein OmpA-like peptidoglycan-associated protein
VGPYDNILFNLSKAVLSPEGKATCDKIVAEFKKAPKATLLIEGHTDNIGSADANKALGQRRADVVKKCLVEQGIDEKRITATSLGDTKPEKPNDNDANRKLNRRVTFKATVKE